MRNQRARVANVVVAGALLLAGCAAGPRLDGAKLGTVAVLVEESTPALKYTPPPSKGGRAAAVVHQTGEFAQGAIAGAFYNPMVLLILPAVPFIAPVFAVDAALTVRSAEEVAKADSALRTALSEVKIHQTLRDRVGELVQARTGRTPVLLAEREDSRSLADRGIQTVLELEVSTVRLKNAGGSIGNPALGVEMPVRVRVVDVVDGTELFRQEFSDVLGVGGKFFRLAENDAKLFREQLDRAVQITGSRIVNRVVRQLARRRAP